MESIKEMYKIGNGPSSSHTMGPAKAASIFKERNPSAAAFHVTLYGSLAATGKGHLTDKAIIESFSPVPVEISWKATESIPPHPNGMKFQALDTAGTVLQGDHLTAEIGAGGPFPIRLFCFRAGQRQSHLPPFQLFQPVFSLR